MRRIADPRRRDTDRHNRPAGVVVVGTDGAHHVIAETNGALNDVGYCLPGQNWTYWNKGTGPGDEEWLNTEERDWTISTGRTCASNLLAPARALRDPAVALPALPLAFEGAVSRPSARCVGARR